MSGESDAHDRGENADDRREDEEARQAMGKTAGDEIGPDQKRQNKEDADGPKGADTGERHEKEETRIEEAGADPHRKGVGRIKGDRLQGPIKCGKKNDVGKGERN